jgi:thiamine-phosphate pyrophosphorylase
VPLNKPCAPIFCYVTDRQSLLPASAAVSQQHSFGALLDSIAGAAAAGVHWIQIREKDLSGKDCSSLVRAALGSAKSSRSAARILVNGRLDVAIAERAAGVHLGEDCLPVSEAKRLVSDLQLASSAQDVLEDFTVGASCHSLAAATSAAAAGADYIFFGPVFPTPSKAAYGPAQGVSRLSEICRAVRVPVFAIGGITVENAAACLRAGASGIAAIRLFQDVRDLPAVMQRLANPPSCD